MQSKIAEITEADFFIRKLKHKNGLPIEILMQGKEILQSKSNRNLLPIEHMTKRFGVPRTFSENENFSTNDLKVEMK